ncbi:MAG: phytanoyl-CoA dioxygenase family protein [Pseudomonadota bacterium]
MAHLTQTQLERYQRDGFLSPIRIASSTTANAWRRRFEAFEARSGERSVALRTDLHLAERWAWEILVSPEVMQPVVDLLGPDVLLWSLNWFIKEPRSGDFVSLHQDANYWGLEPHEVLTAWIALSDASEATGPMRFLPGTHRGVLFEHDNTFAPHNLLSRGQTIAAPIDESRAVSAPLAAGEMSLHHVRLIHGSGPNETDDRRIGMVARYCRTDVRQTKGRDTAVLAAGKDRFGHFELRGAPCIDFGPSETQRHAEAVQLLGQIIHAD